MTKAEMEELKHCEVALEIHLGDNAHMDSARWLMAQRAAARAEGYAKGETVRADIERKWGETLHRKMVEYSCSNMKAAAYVGLENELSTAKAEIERLRAELRILTPRPEQD